MILLLLLILVIQHQPQEVRVKVQQQPIQRIGIRRVVPLQVILRLLHILHLPVSYTHLTLTTIYSV